jgi:hypothetical protein
MQRTSGIEGAAPVWSEEFPVYVYVQSPPSWLARLIRVL